MAPMLFKGMLFKGTHIPLRVQLRVRVGSKSVRVNAPSLIARDQTQRALIGIRR